MLPWQPILERPIFSENEKSLLKLKKTHFYCKFYGLSSYLCSLIGYLYFSLNFDIFLKFWANPRWPPFASHDVTITSFDVITSRCEPQRKHVWTTLLPPSLIIIAFILAKDSPHPPTPPPPPPLPPASKRTRQKKKTRVT